MLTRWADEQSTEQKGKGRMILPEAQQASQQIRTTQNWAVRRRETANDHMVSTASSHMSAIHHEFFCAESRQPGFLVNRCRIRYQLIPAFRRMEIDFDHPRIGRDFNMA